ncbi:MAG TPA: hypothetical protein VJ697_08155 [Nitrososphaeraceae archaeon]|nr:hypothetical protein [Nitrososphaeraceae archaeon]
MIEKFDNLSLNISASQKGAVSTLTKCLDNDESMIIFKREEKEYFILKDNLYEKTNDGWKPSQNSLTEVYTYLKLFSNSASKEKCKTTTYADQEKIYNSIMSYVTEESINSVSHQLYHFYYFLDSLLILPL